MADAAHPFAYAGKNGFAGLGRKIRPAQGQYKKSKKKYKFFPIFHMIILYLKYLRKKQGQRTYFLLGPGPGTLAVWCGRSVKWTKHLCIMKAR